VRRHPHVFADVKVDSSADVERNWSQIKKTEREARGQAMSSVLDGVPRALPALTRAHRLGEKASSVGFDWVAAADVRRKVDEELAEADAAAASGDAEAFEDELGDLLFAIASWARLSDLHAEHALERALVKFSERFRALERDFTDQGRDMKGCSPDELEGAWQDTKRRLRTV
jgi:MazG family protein